MTENKVKRKQIPFYIQVMVFDKYNDETKRFGFCWCCRDRLDVTKCCSGHYISIKNGGNNKISNLRPICYSCKISIGSMNLRDYVEEYGLHEELNKSGKKKK